MSSLSSRTCGRCPTGKPRYWPWNVTATMLGCARRAGALAGYRVEAVACRSCGGWHLTIHTKREEAA